MECTNEFHFQITMIDIVRYPVRGIVKYRPKLWYVFNQRSVYTEETALRSWGIISGPTEAGGPACQFAKLGYWPSPAGGASIRTATKLITYNSPHRLTLIPYRGYGRLGSPTCYPIQATCGTLAEMCHVKSERASAVERELNEEWCSEDIDPPHRYAASFRSGRVIL
jgi:hypothetical protein